LLILKKKISNGRKKDRLLVFPFFVLERKNKKLETVYKDIVKRGDQKIEIVWNVSANIKYGYPVLFNREVHKAIEQIISEILKEEGEIKNPISVTPHEYISLAKQQLDPGNNELKDTGFISKFNWSENGKDDWLIYYYKIGTHLCLCVPACANLHADRPFS
jgi:hypothetical protein